MFNINIFNEVFILFFFKEGYYRNFYCMEIFYIIDEFLLGLWIELGEGVGVRVFRFGGKYNNGFVV